MMTNRHVTGAEILKMQYLKISVTVFVPLDYWEHSY